MNQQLDYRKLSMVGVIFLSLASLLFLALTIGVIKNWFSDHTQYSQTNPPEITVSGTGDVLVVPDIATFSFSVIETAKTVQDAQTAATTLSNKALAYLKSEGIADTDIQTTSYDITPQYEYTTATPTTQTICINCQTGKQTLVGYQVNETVSVKIRKTDQTGTILAGIGSLGVQNISGLTMTVDDQNAVVEQAREKAITDAKTQAQKLAGDLGVRLGRIVDFQDQSSGFPMVYKSQSIGASMGAAPAVAPQIQTGENKVTSNVTITFEIH